MFYLVADKININLSRITKKKSLLKIKYDKF